MFKIYGYYTLPWNATAGAYAIAQSGQPWEAWDYKAYIPLVGTNTSDLIRNAEPAGTRVSPSHWQLDLKYTQGFRFGGRFNLVAEADLFNVMNKQTGYNFEPARNNSAFGTPRIVLRSETTRSEHAAAVLEKVRPKKATSEGSLPPSLSPKRPLAESSCFS